MELKPGVQIAGRYRVERVVEDDAGGTLLATREAQNGLLVAVKVFPAGASQEKLISRFRRAQHIDSPHVPKLFELGGLDDGRTFVAMEYLSGASIGPKADRGPLPIAEAIEVVRQACDAVAAAHRAGVVHRRLRTSKLFEAKKSNGTVDVRVTGFATSLPAEELKPGELPSEVEYLAPEQLAGVNNGDRSADIWALGVILYRLLTGRLPFTAMTRKATAKQIINDDPKPPRSLRSDIPWQVEQAILRCLDKSPAARIESVDALSTTLASFAAALPAAPSAPSTIPPARHEAPPSIVPTTVVKTPTDFPDVTKLSHLLSGDPTGSVEHTPAFSRLRSDGKIERVKVDDVVGMARARRVEGEAARLRGSVRQRTSASVPPISADTTNSKAPAKSLSAPPPATSLSTTQIVVILLVAAVVLGLGCGLVFRALLS